MDNNIQAQDSGQHKGVRYSERVRSARSIGYLDLLTSTSRSIALSRDVGLTIVLNLEDAFGGLGVINSVHYGNI